MWIMMYYPGDERFNYFLREDVRTFPYEGGGHTFPLRGCRVGKCRVQQGFGVLAIASQHYSWTLRLPRHLYLAKMRNFKTFMGIHYTWPQQFLVSW